MPATSIYGTAKRKTTYKKHVTKWAYHRKGVKAGQKWYKRRVPKFITAKVGKPLARRYTWWAYDKKWIQKAKKIMEKKHLIPRARYEDRIDAKKFVTDKRYRKRHSIKGEWIDYERTDYF